MPNHVQNIVRLQGDEKSVKEVLEAVKNDRYGIGSVDFEKIIPMPPLRMECSARTERGCKAYLEFLKSGAESEKAYLDSRPTIPPEEWALGKQACENIRAFGAPTWYEWSIAHWGTKWNAYNEDLTRKNPDALRFQTAWEAPHPILKRLSEMYPGITFEHVWADEDIGANCGRRTYQGGERMEEYAPEGNVEATEFALSVWGYDASDLGLILNAAGTRYVNVEMAEYERIELFGEPALYSKERMTADEIPAGLFCYYLRCTDDGDTLTAVEPNENIRCAGSVITRSPMDFGEQGYIAFTEETSPIFLGERITFGEYMRGEFEEDPENKMEMGM